MVQALNRALGGGNREYKDRIRKAMKKRDKESFHRWLDTFESTLNDEKQIERVKDFRKYIQNHWDRLND
ncbi:UPF0236 family transposase-like protein [Aeribacillus composti]|uniref:UPF0236 family transposase-like protein n=1 Tax=Aeribacillus composti TaxID=1868734 RepID=UPI00406A295B